MTLSLKKFRSRRTILTLSMLCLLPPAFQVDRSAAGEISTTRQVALSTDTVPGGGAIYFDLRPPSINAQGAIAFWDGFGNGIYATAHGRTVGPLRRAVGAGDSSPGILGSFGTVADPSLTDDGSFVFRGFGADSSNRGLFLLHAHGQLELVVDATTVRPGTHETFSPDGPSFPLASDRGYLVFADSTVSTQGVYRTDLKNYTGRGLPPTLSELVTLENGFMFPLPGSEFPPAYTINDSGVVAMVLQRLDFSRGLYLSRPRESLRQLITEGDPAPGGGKFTSNLAAPSVNGSNHVAFFGDFEIGSGIFVVTPRGSISKVVDTGTEVPGHPQIHFDGFQSIHLTDNGTIIFQASYLIQNYRFSGIYKKSCEGLEIIFDQFDGLIVNGQRLSLVVNDVQGERVLNLYLAPRFVDVRGNRLKVAFQQEFPPEVPGGEIRSGIFLTEQRFVP